MFDVAVDLSALVADLFPSVAVALVGSYFGLRTERRVGQLRTHLTNQTGFFSRKLEKYEQLWPLIAQCNRQQMALTRLKQDQCDLGDSAKMLADARRNLKNFVYNHSLYFSDETKQLVQRLDTQLSDRYVHDVSCEIAALETHLKQVINSSLQV